MKKQIILIILLNLIIISNIACGSSEYKEFLSKNRVEQLKWEWFIEPAEYKDFDFIDEDLIAVKDNSEKYGAINLDKDIVIPFKYTYIYNFFEGVSFAEENGNVFLIDKLGNPISEETYDNTYGFSEGLAAVKKDDKWSFIDSSGNLVIRYQYDDVKKFRENLAAVKKDDKWGFIDNVGETITEVQYDEVKDFNEGCAAVKKDGKWGFISNVGETITEVQYDEVKDFNEGYAAVNKDNKWGFIDKHGDISIGIKYDNVGNFSEGKAAVNIGYREGHLGEWAYVDYNDNIVIDFFPYDASSECSLVVDEFKDGLAFVSKSLYYIIDENGKDVFAGDSKFFISSLVYNAKYDAIPGYVYTDESMKIRKYGLMGLDGSQRLEPIFDYVNGIHENFVFVENKIEDEYRSGLIKILE